MIIYTKDDSQGLGGLALLLSRRLFALLPTGFVHFVDGEARAGRLVLFALLVTGTVATSAATRRRPCARLDATIAFRSATFTFTLLTRKSIAINQHVGIPRLGLSIEL